MRYETSSLSNTISTSGESLPADVSLLSKKITSFLPFAFVTTPPVEEGCLMAIPDWSGLAKEGFYRIGR